MKIFFPISSLCVALLATAAIFTACQKEAKPILPAGNHEQMTDDNPVTDRTDVLGFSFTVGNAVDLQYRVTNSNGTVRYFSKNFFTTTGSCSSNVPGLDPCPRVEVRGRLQYNSPGTETVSWTFTRTSCDPLNGTTAVTAPSSTSWSSIPWQLVKESACECF